MTARRYIRDTVSNDWKPPHQVELDRRMKWLDAVEREVKGLHAGESKDSIKVSSE